MEERRFTIVPGDGSPPLVLAEEFGYSVQAAGTTGLFGGAWRIGTTVLPGLPGVQVDSVLADATNPSLGLLVEADSAADFQARVRGLVSRCLPNRGMARLEVTTVRTGETRSLPVYVTGEGLEGSEDDDALMPGRWWRCVLRLLAPDGMWRGPAIAERWNLEPPARSPWFPMLTARILATTGFGGRRWLLNPGDHEVYPPWVITGPATEVSLIHHGLRREFRLVTPIPSDGLGATVTVDMGRGRQRVANGFAAPGTSNLFAAVASDPEGWALQPGLNDVEVRVAGAAATTSVSVTYEPLFASS